MLGFSALWAFWVIVQTILLHRYGISWKLSFIDASISNSILALLSYTAITIYRFYQPGKTNRFYRLIFALGISILFILILRFSLNAVLAEETSYLEFLELSMPIRHITAFLIISFVTVLNWMWNVLKEQRELEERRNETEKLIKEAELVKLRQQLQPHFLFNSLNSISALAGSKPNEARKMIQQLSDFLRGTLKKDGQQIVLLKEEVEHLKLYLEIEKVRFGHRLNFKIDILENVMDAEIPLLLLQPIVENAIKFGLYGTIEDVEVGLNAHVDSGYLCLEIKNPFDSQTQGGAKGTGFGLSSAQRRLFLLYSRNDLLTTDKKGNIFITRLKIPQIKI
ncbi:sensor histidine kinase [Aurantibacillus circumpalustris]|uniref:sensor histidine kinase n=1 Tax=Aurantibacillus circumpalustris TaxID=3036359 RepID=UPI00295C1CDA|nr:histidine kinase [Aurantibacillus circumpalustris]